MPESPEATVRALFDAFARRDPERAVALVDPAFELWAEGTAELSGRAGPYLGADGIRRYFADVAELWDELRVDPSDLRAAGAGVVVFGTVHGRAAGRELRSPAIWVFKLRDGLVAYARVAATAAEALEIAAS